MRIKKVNEVLTGRLIDQNYSDILFESLNIRQAVIKKTTFTNIHFKNCYLGFNSSFENVTFDNCKFFGKYSSLGNPKNTSTNFDSCSFLNSQLIGLDILNGTTFYNCTFSGKFKNIILRDSNGNLINSGTQFSMCDLRNLSFEDVSIYGKDLFPNTKLPKSGLLFYDNKNDALIKKAKEICSKIKEDYKIEVEVIFNANLHSGQGIIILDQFFLDTFFKTENSKHLFEKIVENYRILN